MFAPDLIGKSECCHLLITAAVFCARILLSVLLFTLYYGTVYSCDRQSFIRYCICFLDFVDIVLHLDVYVTCAQKFKGVTEDWGYSQGWDGFN